MKTEGQDPTRVLDLAAGPMRMPDADLPRPF
jgi:hypothetical protein